MPVVKSFFDAYSGLGMPERAGLLAGSTGVGLSFSRGLMPRTTADQAVITGVSAALNYGLTATAQSLIETVAGKVARGRGYSAERRTTQQAVLLAGDVAAIGVGIAGQRFLARRKDEPLVRAWARTTSWRLLIAGVAGSIIVTSDMAVARVGGADRSWSRVAPVAIPLGAAFAAWDFHRLRSKVLSEGLTLGPAGESLEDSRGVAAGRAVAIGTAVSVGLYLAATGEKVFARGIGVAVTTADPRLELIGRPIGHAAAFSMLGFAGYKGLQYVFRSAETSGGAVEAAYSEAPTSEYVSAGPRSAVPADTIGREGRRFVNMALTPEEIESVMGGQATPPIRVFVGLETKATASGRADLAMREMEELGAFERSHIVFMSPTGTGYINYVTAESLEYLTRGDVALVAMQYSLRPSPLSLFRVGIGIDQNNSFLHALKWRLASMPADQRPTLHIFGESLGATTAEDVFADEGTAGLHRAGIDRGLFLGTPAATTFRTRWLSKPDEMDPDGEIVEVDNYEEFLALPEEVRERARYFFLTHHNDSMPKFWFPVAVQEPDWMGPAETREPGVPHETEWQPYTTFLITLIDVKNAMNVVPGHFVADGHDYRADLARFTSLAYGLPADDETIDALNRTLAERELKWAELRVIGEKYASAKAAVADQLATWGIDDVPVLPTQSTPSPPNREL